MKPAKIMILAALLAGAAVTTGSSQTLLWSDNFNAPDTTNFDGALLDGRLGGPLAAEVVARSDGYQQWISNNQLLLVQQRIRFQYPPAGGWYSWSGGSGAAQMLAAGGMQIAFDYLPTNVTSTNWINASIGFASGATGQRVNAGDTDYGVLIRNSGGTECFKNGANQGPRGNFPATATTRHVEYNYACTSFADGSPVKTRVYVDGVLVAADTFTWNGNAGNIYFMVEVGEPNTLVDNLTVSTVGVFFESALDSAIVSSGAGTASGVKVGTLSGSTWALGAEPSTFALVAGDGDDDNAKFQIAGGELQTSGTFDFKTDPNGTQYSIRVEGTGNNTGGTSQQVMLITLLKDDDSDGILDTWEQSFAGNTTDLNGLAAGPGPGAGTGDFDGDGLTDLQEYELSKATYPLIDPTDADTDADTLGDGAEVNGTAGVRPPTDPTLADTDGDGLDDAAESNTGTFVSSTNTGSDPTAEDTDGDGLDDGFETANNPPYDPNVDDSALDTDGDNLTTAQEVVAGTSPILADTDADGLNDDVELAGSANPYTNATDLPGDPPSGVPGDPTNPVAADSDADDIPDGEEVAAGDDGYVTNPNRADSDGDGLADGFEVVNAGEGYSPLVDDSALDTDGDTLTTAQEVAAGTSVLLADTDADGLNDDLELFGSGYRPPTNPLIADTDYDGLGDLAESNSWIFVDANDTGTDPTNQDSDFDGARDGYELAQGTDLFDPNNLPPPLGAGVSVARITAEELTGISPTKTYTHKVSGGGGALVNGVLFDPLHFNVYPPNFTWETFGKGLDWVTPVNYGAWQPALGNVTGAGLIQMLGGFAYSGTGDVGGSRQRYTLSGLTPGENYIFRLYTRVWDPAGSGRPIDITFTNGAQVVTPFSALAMDRPGFVLGTGNHDDAYYLEFAYQAQGTELVVDAALNPYVYGVAGNQISGSLHMYGLSNEVAGDAVYAVGMTGGGFTSGALVGTPVATLTGYSDAVPEASTFALVAGDGDTDNGKFQVVGNEIQVNSDFTGANSIEGQQFFVRVKGTDVATGARTAELAVVLTVTLKDDDLDALPDAWELAWAGNLLDLVGDGSADYDGDLLPDFEEYQISIGAVLGVPAYPLINPVAADTDGDTLEDGEEVYPTSFRPPTNPTLADTDGDGLDDLAETNTGAMVDPSDTGTNPTLADSDGDGVADGIEVNNGSDPNDPLNFLPAAIKVVELTSDAASGISTAKTYTHLISGGNPATVNGVAFAALTPASTPANFSWSVNGAKYQVLDNLGAWSSAAVGLNGTELEQLFDSFTYSDGSPGFWQKFTLSGLTIGQTYQLRLYIRPWEPGGSGRPVAFVITNGAQVFNPMLSLPEDYPGVVLGNGNNNSAYYIAFDYTADSTTLVIDAAVPPGGDGSYHMYAMSNEVVVPSGELVITHVARSAAGEIVIDFKGAPDTFYKVTKSPDLASPFVPLTAPLSVLTDGTGAGQAIVPASEASEAREFYRMEQQ